MRTLRHVVTFYSHSNGVSCHDNGASVRRGGGVDPHARVEAAAAVQVRSTTFGAAACEKGSLAPPGTDMLRGDGTRVGYMWISKLLCMLVYIAVLSPAFLRVCWFYFTSPQVRRCGCA